MERSGHNSMRPLDKTSTPHTCRISMFLAISCVLGGCEQPSGKLPPDYTNSVKMEMAPMSPVLFVSRYETTQSQFQEVMGSNPSLHLGAMHPVENISLDEALEFCKRLTQKEAESGLLPGDGYYDLPTYGEWLRFSKGAPLKGSVTPGMWQGPLESHQKIGTGDVSRTGIYDTRGNVSEFLKDVYPSTGSNLIAGPNWRTYRKDFLELDNRAGMLSPDGKCPTVGFRCVLRSKSE